MKFIIDGGISTTNVPPYTRDALLLATHMTNLSGVCLKVFTTSDGELVCYMEGTVSNGKEAIADLNLKHLQRKNFGERVRKHSILKLQEALQIFESASQMLVLGLNDDIYDEKYLQGVLNVTNLYPNIDIYIKTTRMDNLKFLQKHSQKERIGAVINKNNQDLWNENLDFFSIDETICSYSKVKEKLGLNKRMMMENVNSVERYNEIDAELKELSDSTYMIIDTSSNLTAITLSYFNQK